MDKPEMFLEPARKQRQHRGTWLMILVAGAGILTNVLPGGYLERRAGRLIQWLWGSHGVLDNDYITRLFKEAGPGNLFVLFQNAEMDNGRHREQALMFYYRANYVRHPFRIWVTQERIPITDGKTILENNHHPTSEWLRAMDIKQIAVINLRDIDHPPTWIPVETMAGEK